MSQKEIEAYRQDSSARNNEGDDEQKIPYRFTNAALDALRQLGVHTAGYPVPGRRWLLNGWGWNAAGYWLVRQSRKKSKTFQQHFLPTLVLIDGESGIVYAWVSGMEEMAPYHEVLLLAGQGKLEVIGKHNEVATRIPQDLDRIGLNRDVVLVVDAAQSNMRNKVWRWLQDQRISPDEIEFNDGQKWSPEDRPHLRVVRVRSVEHETPEWYAKGDTIGLSAGLHKIGNRTFVSTSQTATTQQFNRNLTKTNTANASRATPSPAYYELTVGMMQPHDDAEYVADFVHILRDASTQYQDETAHALPLHLGKLIEEYLLWIEDDDENDEIDEDKQE
ncbi:MAG: RNAseH domain-containing protein [Chloroflexi bacterium]|nr:RNAseH domain-containing protein [Chloroflexota bacterium]